MLDLGFGLLLKNCVHSRLETFGNPQFGQQITKFSFEIVVLKPDQRVIHQATYNPIWFFKGPCMTCQSVLHNLYSS